MNYFITPYLLHSPELGALTQLYANTAPEAGVEGGVYYVPWARKGKTVPAAEDFQIQDRGMRHTDPAVSYFDAQIQKHAHPV